MFSGDFEVKGGNDVTAKARKDTCGTRHRFMIMIGLSLFYDLTFLFTCALLLDMFFLLDTAPALICHCSYVMLLLTSFVTRHHTPSHATAVLTATFLSLSVSLRAHLSDSIDCMPLLRSKTYTCPSVSPYASSSTASSAAPPPAAPAATSLFASRRTSAPRP